MVASKSATIRSARNGQNREYVRRALLYSKVVFGPTFLLNPIYMWTCEIRKLNELALNSRF